LRLFTTPLRLIALLAIISMLNACGTAPNASGDMTPTGFYKVAQGDTLYGIARKFRQTVPGLVRLNGLKDADDIRVDQLLRINTVRAATSGPAAPSTSGKRASSPAAAREDEAAATDNEPPPRDWIWPTHGAQSAGFGAKKGIEISGQMGQDVRAANAGSVSFVGGGIRGYGNLVIIKHSGNVLSVYAHNKVVVVKEGQTVAKGQKIAEMGNSDSDTVMLYFEIRRNGKPVDPSAYLPKH
jgi:murein DD-endopeptidase MepM/ murein hydrolase activator NlpD